MGVKKNILLNISDIISKMFNELTEKKRFGINTPHILWAVQSNYDFMVILIKCAYQMSTYT